MNFIILPKFFLPKFYTQKLRVGRKYDGGYIVSRKALKNSEILFSFGLYDDWSFEKDFLKYNQKAKVYIFDGSIDIFFWIKYLIKNLIYFVKIKISFLKFLKNYLQFLLFPFFILKKRVNFKKKYIISSNTKKSTKTVSVLDLIKKYQNNKIFFKIDIENNEYRILKDLIKVQNNIECLVIEFHNINKKLDKIKKFIETIDLKLIHVHVNNYGKIIKIGLPSVVELTFTKNYYCKKKQLKNFPVKNLDYPNNPNKPDLPIRFIEY